MDGFNFTFRRNHIKKLVVAAVGTFVVIIIVTQINFRRCVGCAVRISSATQRQNNRQVNPENIKNENKSLRSVALYTNPKDLGTCKRIRHVSFIKTYKTGSSSLANLFNRFALRYNVSQLLFMRYCKVTSPVGQTRCPLHMHPPFRKLDFELTADHLEFDKDFLLSMLPPDTVFISILRKPLSRLKSSLYFRSLYKAMENSPQDPVEKFLSMHGVYKDWWSTPHMYEFMKLPPKAEYNKDPAAYTRYFEQLEQEIPLMAINEYYDESLVYIRRRLCWETKDIIYSWLKPAKRGKKDFSEHSKIVLEKHKQYNPVDYALYEYFNNSLHNKLRKEPPDFWTELEYFKKVNRKISNFCKNITDLMDKDPETILMVSKTEEVNISFERTKWGDAFTINGIDCALMMINEDTFRNIQVVRQYPEVCSNLHKYYLGVNELRYSISTTKVRLHPHFCDKNTVSKGVPLKVLRHHDAYDWASEIPRVGVWHSRLRMYSQGMLGSIDNV